MNKRVMVIGAIQGEIPLVKAFHDLGCYVIVVSKDVRSYPCYQLADKAYELDIMDKEAVLDLARRENVSAVASNVVERAVRIVAWLAEKLNLEGIGIGTAESFSDKFRMRQACEKAESGVCVPDYAKAKSIEEALSFAHRSGYPLMMKPLDNGGSRGVFKIYNESELREKFDLSLEFSLREASVIIEKFVDGIEYNVDAFTHNYVCENTGVAFKEKFDIEDTCIPKSYVIQDAASCGTDLEKRLLAGNKQLVESMHLKFGITHANYIYQPEEDKIYLVEIAARGGGDGISQYMVELATGVNVSFLLACYSLGIDFLGGRKMEIKKGSAAWYGFQLPEGVITKVQGLDEVKKIPGVYDVKENFVLGKTVRKMANGGDKFGPIWIYGKDRSECGIIFQRVKELLKVEVTGADGCVRQIIW